MKLEKNFNIKSHQSSKDFLTLSPSRISVLTHLSSFVPIEGNNKFILIFPDCYDNIASESVTTNRLDPCIFTLSSDCPGFLISGFVSI